MKSKVFLISKAIWLLLPFASFADDMESIVLEKVSIERHGVTFSATPEFDNSGLIAIDLAMNTHTVDLDFDMIESSVLILSNGDRIKPLLWGGDPSGGHHRFGYLLFPYREEHLKPFELIISFGSSDSRIHFQWSEDF